MKLLRIRLRDYRGIEACDVAFDPVGVTIVQGPNEIGKSSLAEAIHVVFGHPDTARSRSILALQPVGRDVGVEIELAVECGPYAFRYLKRFLRDRVTELHISQPRPESLTGREAHDRVERILAEHVDMNLWQSLRVQQGVPLDQAMVAGSRSLSSAMERAAGMSPIGEREHALFERVTAEHRRYFTEGGRPLKAITEGAEAALRAQLEKDGLKAALDALQKDVGDAERLDREIVGLLERLAMARDAAAAQDMRWRAIESLGSEMEKAKLRAAAAHAQAAEAVARAASRTRQVQDLEVAAAQRARADSDATAALDALRSVELDVTALEREGDALNVALAQATRALALRRADYDHVRDTLELRPLQERRAGIARALDHAAEARHAIELARVDDAALDALRALHVAVEQARARLTLGSPTVELRALTALRVDVDGETLALDPATSPVSRTVSESMTVRLPGALEIAIRAGAPVAALTRDLAEAERRLAGGCEAVGVEDLDGAEHANRGRARALARLEEARRRVKELLEGAALEAVDGAVADLSARIEGYAAGRDATLALPEGLDAARTARDAAERAVEGLRAPSDALQLKLAAARRRGQEASHARESALATRGVLEGQRRSTERALSEAREAASDEALAEAVAVTASRAAREAHELAEATARLDASGPDTARLRLDNARDVVARLEAELYEIQHERTAVDARLRLQGERGLAEALDDAEAKALALADRAERVQHMAAAARRLFETLSECREQSVRTYLGPLRDEINRLGRMLHDPSFSVELGEDLRIASRTVDGETLVYDCLGVGAKEQLAIISRLASALIVSQHGGVPVILDDTLGNTDPERLAHMGVILGMAGKECQVIVLTCYPDRFRGIGNARIVRLPAAAPAASPP